MKKNCGLTTFDGNDYRVRVNSDQPDAGQIDTLLHEWRTSPSSKPTGTRDRGACCMPKSMGIGRRIWKTAHLRATSPIALYEPEV